MAEKTEIKVNLKPVKVDTDPSVYVMQIEVSSPDGSWNETARTTMEAEMFLKGIQCGLSLSREPNTTFNKPNVRNLDSMY